MGPGERGHCIVGVRCPCVKGPSFGGFALAIRGKGFVPLHLV